MIDNRVRGDKAHDKRISIQSGARIVHQHGTYSQRVGRNINLDSSHTIVTQI